MCGGGGGGGRGAVRGYTLHRLVNMVRMSRCAGLSESAHFTCALDMTHTVDNSTDHR